MKKNTHYLLLSTPSIALLQIGCSATAPPSTASSAPERLSLHDVSYISTDAPIYFPYLPWQEKIVARFGGNQIAALPIVRDGANRTKFERDVVAVQTDNAYIVYAFPYNPAYSSSLSEVDSYISRPDLPGIFEEKSLELLELIGDDDLFDKDVHGRSHITFYDSDLNGIVDKVYMDNNWYTIKLALERTDR